MYQAKKIKKSHNEKPEAKRQKLDSKGFGDTSDSDSTYCLAPLAELAHTLFVKGVDEMGLGNEDDSSLWKVYDSIKDETNQQKSMLSMMNDADSIVFNPTKVIDVAAEPRHNVVLQNSYTRALLVKFSEGDTTLPHTHSKDSVYMFMTPNGAKVKNRILSQGCLDDAMQFGEVRYGQHHNCPLTHVIHAVEGGGGVLCVDAEVLRPPPKTKVTSEQEVESIQGHTLVKIREKVRVFQLNLEPKASVVCDYNFFHLVVVREMGKIKTSTYNCVEYTENKAVGDCEWHEPICSKKIENIGSTPYSCFIIQWRNFKN